jgi:hypothetical protein
MSNQKTENAPNSPLNTLALSSESSLLSNIARKIQQIKMKEQTNFIKNLFYFVYFFLCKMSLVFQALSIKNVRFVDIQIIKILLLLKRGFFRVISDCFLGKFLVMGWGNL